MQPLPLTVVAVRQAPSYQPALQWQGKEGVEFCFLCGPVLGLGGQGGSGQVCRRVSSLRNSGGIVHC